MNIFKGKKAVFGIQLTVDKKWRYVMTSTDVLTVEIIDNSGNKYTFTFSASDVNPVDKQIAVEITPEVTSEMSEGRGILHAWLNDIVVIPATEIYVKEA